MSRDERALEAGLSDPAVPPALARGELEILGLLPRSSNYTFLVRATGEDGDQALGVYKPQRGEMPLWDFPEGTLCRREVAAYVVARALGWPNVPPTILRDGPEGLGSVQTFVTFDPEEHYFTLQERFVEDFRAVAAFDLVVNNADRKGGHCLLGEDGRIWLIDHGVCFSAEPKLRTVIWEYMDEPIPPSLLAGIERLGIAVDEGGPECDELGALLNEEELLALRRRIAEIAGSLVFPGPGGDRPFPWPPV
ncbi:MAG TPA: SCO1664 family protein [Actinomycetota bacterium]|nr:SCO1664 family protein [Actinomycetota bacterium]